MLKNEVSSTILGFRHVFSINNSTEIHIFPVHLLISAYFEGLIKDIVVFFIFSSNPVYSWSTPKELRKNSFVDRERIYYARPNL